MNNWIKLNTCDLHDYSQTNLMAHIWLQLFLAMPLDMFVMSTFMVCMTTTMEWLMITTNLSCVYNYGLVYVTNDYKYK
jgi:hypothetical protein